MVFNPNIIRFGLLFFSMVWFQAGWSLTKIKMAFGHGQKKKWRSATAKKKWRSATAEKKKWRSATAKKKMAF